MTVAVVSDIHDNIWNLARVLQRIRHDDAARLIFLGDFCAPFTLAQIADGFDGPIDAVFGNNDGDAFLLSAVASKYDHVALHGQYAELEIDGRAVAITHYPEVARRLAEGAPFDAVFYGHDHTAFQEIVGNTLLANPGEVMGRFGSPGFAYFRTKELTFERVAMEERS